MKKDLFRGGGGIRTPGTLARTLVFKTSAINQTLPPLQGLVQGFEFNVQGFK